MSGIRQRELRKEAAESIDLPDQKYMGLHIYKPVNNGSSARSLIQDMVDEGHRDIRAAVKLGVFPPDFKINGVLLADYLEQRAGLGEEAAIVRARNAEYIKTIQQHRDNSDTYRRRYYAPTGSED